MYTTTEEAGALYQSSRTIGENRARYFEANGFGEGGYDEAWVTLKTVLGLRIGFPNTPARVRAVKLHDVHHVLTGYGTNWTGEAEIGAFEIGGGCGRHYAAWLLNGGTLVYGIVIAPKNIFRAFVRGRHAQTLYGEASLRDAILQENTGDLRAKLHIEEADAATASDIAAFVLAILVALSVALSPLLALTAVLSAWLG